MFIEVKNLDKIYELGENSIKVLNDVSFQLEKGELCTLLGPSGSGKSTLLNAIGGLEKVERGEIIIDGTDIAKLKNMALTEYRRQKLGFVFQFYNLIPDLNVKENIEVGANISKDPINVEELLNDLGLWEHKDKFPKQLSGGQQQRCAIGRALVKKPAVLLCDEPTGALDYKTSKEILALIERVNKEYNTTIIIATHNEEITGMAKRIVRLKDGKINADIVNENIKSAEELEW
jgi:ABC-type antimicrobial peptide transport system, ATPase component